MGDFLSNLVTRSTAVNAELRPHLRPRPVSIYESSRSTPSSLVDEEQADPGEVNPRAVPISEPHMGPVKEPSSQAGQSFADGLAWLEAWRKRYMTPKPDANTALPQQPEPDRQGAAEAPRTAPGPSRENRPLEPQDQRVVLRELLIQPSPKSPTIAPAQSEVTVIPTRETNIDRLRLPDRKGDSAIKAIQTNPERPGIQPALPPVMVSQPISASRPAQPTIHVSIGRIEVRLTAAAGQPATPSGRKPATVLSLEDYLRMRNGGGR